MFWRVAISFANPPKYVHGTFAEMERDMGREADHDRVTDREDEVALTHLAQMHREFLDAVLVALLKVLAEEHHGQLPELSGRQYIFLMRVLNYVYACHVIRYVRNISCAMKTGYSNVNLIVI